MYWTDNGGHIFAFFLEGFIRLIPTFGKGGLSISIKMDIGITLINGKVFCLMAYSFIRYLCLPKVDVLSTAICIGIVV